MKGVKEKNTQCALQVKGVLTNDMTRDPWEFMGTVSKTSCRRALFWGSKKNTETEGNVDAEKE